ncbi:hypothetical protein JXB41_03195 [Candidatus Woesearchaeota archaeon]|nr:hypothetical protein [Candidatus Woesearchaeota archaeon]
MALLFLAFGFYFVVFILNYHRKLKIQKIKKQDVFFSCLVIGISAFIIFILMKDTCTGQVFQKFRFIMGNLFIKPIYYDTLFFWPKSFAMVPYTILIGIFHVKIIPEIVLVINKILAVFFLFVVFLISKKLFKSNFIALFVFFSFISSEFVKLNLSTINYTLISLLFTYLSMFFLFDYISKKNKESFILSGLSLLIASYYRIELSFLLGVPYLFFVSIFIKKNKFIKKITAVFLILLLIRLMVVIMAFTTMDVAERQGTHYNEFTTFNVLKHSVYIFHNNIIVNQDLNIKYGFVNLFDYVCILVSLILVFNLITHLSWNKKIKSDNLPFHFCAIAYLFFMFFQLGFTVHGLRYSFKYSVHVFICAILLSFYGIRWVASKFLKIKNQKALNFFLILLFIVLTIITADNLNYSFAFETQPLYAEMLNIKKNIELDSSCKIIKIHSGQPPLDFFYGLQENAVFFGMPPEFYENLGKYNKKGKCFYYYNQKYYTDYDYNQNFVFRIDVNEIDKLMGSCKKTIEFESSFQGRSVELIKYTCT